jgi:hypothetical protein
MGGRAGPRCDGAAAAGAPGGRDRGGLPVVLDSQTGEVYTEDYVRETL